MMTSNGTNLAAFRALFGDEKVPKEIMNIVWKVQDGLNIPRSLHGLHDEESNSSSDDEDDDDDGDN